MSDDKLFDEMLDIISRQMMAILFLQISSNSILYMVIGGISGYARALEDFDKKLPKLFSVLNREDFWL